MTVSASDVVDLTSPAALASVGLAPGDIEGDDLGPCQLVGGAAAWLGRGGLISPSARAPGHNLVALVTIATLEDEIEILAQEVIEEPSR